MTKQDIENNSDKNSNKVYNYNHSSTDENSEDKEAQRKQNNTKNNNENQNLTQVKKQPMTKKKKIIIISIVVFSLIVVGLGSWFGYNYYVYGNILPQSVSSGDPVFKGYDVVEYHNLEADDKGVKGNSDFEYEFDKAFFWFKNQENLDKFKSNPQKYAPQIGGFCTWGLQNKGSAPWSADWLGPPCDPDHGWTVYKGKLYCNFSKGLATEFFEPENAEKNLKHVEDMWIGWFGSLDAKAGYFNNRCYSNNYRFCQVKKQDFKQGDY